MPLTVYETAIVGSAKKQTIDLLCNDYSSHILPTKFSDSLQRKTELNRIRRKGNFQHNGDKFFNTGILMGTWTL